MTSYVIYRKGSNAANQPSKFDWVPVYGCEADSREAAVKAAEEAGVTCYANQVLEARPASRCSRADIDAANEATAALESHLGQF